VDAGAEICMAGESASAGPGKCENTPLSGPGRYPSWLLATFAEGKGWCLSDSWLSSLIPREGGNEHETYTDPSQLGWRVKVTGPGLALCSGRSRSWLSELAYLDSIRLANVAFGDGAELVGVIPTIAGSRLVIRQPEVEASDPDNPHPTKPEINDFLRLAGFDYAEGAWLRDADGMVLEDEHEGNFILTSQGVRPIDIHLHQLAHVSLPVMPWAECPAYRA
jgi:hypothetical protein